jgi:hypothetical protein
MTFVYNFYFSEVQSVVHEQTLHRNLDSSTMMSEFFSLEREMIGNRAAARLYPLETDIAWRRLRSNDRIRSYSPDSQRRLTFAKTHLLRRSNNNTTRSSR